MKSLKQIMEDAKKILPGVFKSHMDSHQMALHLKDHFDEAEHDHKMTVIRKSNKTIATSHADKHGSFDLHHLDHHLDLLKAHHYSDHGDGPADHFMDHNSVTIRTTDGEHHNFKMDVDRSKHHPDYANKGYGNLYFTHRKL